MQKLISTSILCLFVLLIASSHKPHSFIPPGTVQINDTLWYDKTEISNLAWLEYVAWVQKEYGATSVQYQKSLPDTLVWRNKTSYNEPYVQYYFRHPAYKNYPVVGISYEQATDYCKWRTDRVIEVMKKQFPNKTYVFEYRLPDKSEWQGVALLGLSKKSKMKLRSKANQVVHLYNFKSINTNGRIAGTSVNNGADITAPCASYFPNEKDLYNLYGNVAEMVREKGKCVGGSWKHTQEDGAFNKTIEYRGTESWLGFRCVCVVKNP